MTLPKFKQIEPLNLDEGGGTSLRLRGAGIRNSKHLMTVGGGASKRYADSEVHSPTALISPREEGEDYYWRYIHQKNQNMMLRASLERKV